MIFDPLGYESDGISHLTLRFGFMETPDVPRALLGAQELLARQQVPFHPRRVSYFLSSITIAVGDTPGMQRWRKLLFVVLARNAASPVDYFRLPREATVSMSSRIEL